MFYLQTVSIKSINYEKEVSINRLHPSLFASIDSLLLYNVTSLGNARVSQEQREKLREESSNDIYCQFHQHFTSNFYSFRSQKHFPK